MERVADRARLMSPSITSRPSCWTRPGSSSAMPIGCTRLSGTWWTTRSAWTPGRWPDLGCACAGTLTTWRSRLTITGPGSRWSTSRACSSGCTGRTPPARDAPAGWPRPRDRQMGRRGPRRLRDPDQHARRGQSLQDRAACRAAGAGPATFAHPDGGAGRAALLRDRRRLGARPSSSRVQIPASRP